MEKEILYWITGMSGAGKTTIGSALYYDLKRTNSNIVILDGDILRELIGGGYSENDRLQRAKKYCLLCKVLVDQGITVVICTVAMFEEVRVLNRKYIEKYIEIFLDVPFQVLVSRNKKGLYSGQKEGKIKNVAGMDVKVEFPVNPDIVIKNDGSMSVNECVDIIKRYKFTMQKPNYNDKRYWNKYYANDVASIENKESLFAREVLQYIKPGKTLIEFGCRNGRDSLFWRVYQSISLYQMPNFERYGKILLYIGFL